METVADRLLETPITPALIDDLRSLLGEDGVLTARAQRFPYESDGLAMLRVEADLVLLPRNTEETSRALRLLHAARVAVVPRGAGTGLTGGATPVAGGAVVATTRMRRVLELDLEDGWARVEAGVVNVDLSAACAHGGRIYAPDPSSQTACTIGGNVANDSGGPHCFKYGSTTRHVLGLVLVQHDGEVLDLTGPAVEPFGFDLAGLIVGTEGTFGIVTEVTVALVPAPEHVRVLLGVFATLDDACDAVTDMIGAHVPASAIEILDRLTIEAVEASVFAAGYPTGAEAVLLVEVEGSEVEVAEASERVRELFRAHAALETRVADDLERRQRLWAGRKGAFGAMGRIAPDLYVADAVVPRTRLRELVRRTTEICRERGLRLANVFHAGDGNLHPNICYDRRDAAEVARVLDAGHEILKVCAANGGSLTGEHGIGLEKQAELELVFSPEDLAAMCAARDVFDPDRRMNPGKLVPERACLETRTLPPPQLDSTTQ
ncbi:MAG: FAD-linked oxidase C-terminal domain-containing protein [Planctomycetota bacterium]